MPLADTLKTLIRNAWDATNVKAQRDGILDRGFIRFFGTVELPENGPVHDRIVSLLLPREQTHAGADAGIGALSSD